MPVVAQTLEERMNDFPIPNSIEISHQKLFQTMNFPIFLYAITYTNVHYVAIVDGRKNCPYCNAFKSSAVFSTLNNCLEDPQPTDGSMPLENQGTVNQNIHQLSSTQNLGGVCSTSTTIGCKPTMVVKIFGTFHALIDSSAAWSMGSQVLYQLCLKHNISLAPCSQHFSMSNSKLIDGYRYIAEIQFGVGGQQLLQRFVLFLI
ncbi:hypothetical protein CHUAL_010249 [Chamberlinius hualienensis]